MNFNAELMYKDAVIATLKKEIEELKEERVSTLMKLEVMGQEVSSLKSAMKIQVAEAEEATRKKDEEVKSWKTKFDDLKKIQKARKAKVYKLEKNSTLYEEKWSKEDWGQDDDKIFLGDATKFRLNLESIQKASNEDIKKFIAYHVNWWLEIGRTEQGSQFLKQPGILKYRNDISIAIEKRLQELRNIKFLSDLQACFQDMRRTLESLSSRSM